MFGACVFRVPAPHREPERPGLAGRVRRRTAHDQRRSQLGFPVRFPRGTRLVPTASFPPLLPGRRAKEHLASGLARVTEKQCHGATVILRS